MYISFHDTYAYPGSVATVQMSRVASEDNYNAIAEFSDGTVTESLWEELEPQMAVLHIAGYRTAKGTQVPDKILTLERDDGHWKVIAARTS